MQYNRTELNKLHQNIDEGNLHPVYLLFGERYLCNRAAKALVAHLLPKASNEAVIKIDGEDENVSDTMNKLRTFSLFGTRQVIMVNNSRLFHSRAVGKNIWNNANKAFAKKDLNKTLDYLGQLGALAGLSSQENLGDLSAGQWKTRLGFPRPSDWNWAAALDLPESQQQESATDGATLVSQTLEKGIPQSNHLIILAETVDKRKKLFKLIKETGVIIDLSVDKSYSKAAKQAQAGVIRELINTTFSEMNSKPGPGVMEMLMERTGFHPVAAVRETEKVCLYAGDAPQVTIADIETITSQTSEAALFELNEAFASHNISRALLLLNRLLHDGIHPLAVVATLRNLIRKLLFLRSLQDQTAPTYQRGQQFNHFQNNYLPQIKEKTGPSDFLEGHPFALFMGFKQAENFSQNSLKQGLKKLLDVEFNLKGSGVRESLILENFFLSSLV